MAKLSWNSMSMIAVVLLNSVAVIHGQPFPFYRQIFLPSPAFGPDSVAFAQNNLDIAYVTVSDGRVLRLDVKSGVFEDFAYTSPLRTKELCDGNTDPNLAPTCGKVIGLSVDNVNQILYAVDANLGLFSIQIPQGGQATLITNTAGGTPLKFCSGIDVHPISGDVYFTDASQTLDYRNVTPSATVPLDSTGRLIKYNPNTQEVTVLLYYLSFPSGPAAGSDGTYVLLSEIGGGNIVKYFISGFRAGTSQILLKPAGTPHQIKRSNTPNEFWVNVDRLNADNSIQPNAYKIDLFGNRPERKDLSQQYPDISVVVTQETDPLTIFVGSPFTNYITKYSDCELCL